MLTTERTVQRLVQEIPQGEMNQGTFVLMQLFAAIGKDLSTLEKHLKQIEKRQAKVERELRRR